MTACVWATVSEHSTTARCIYHNPAILCVYCCVQMSKSKGNVVDPCSGSAEYDWSGCCMILPTQGGITAPGQRYGHPLHTGVSVLL